MVVNQKSSVDYLIEAYEQLGLAGRLEDDSDLTKFVTGRISAQLAGLVYEVLGDRFECKSLGIQYEREPNLFQRLIAYEHCICLKTIV